MGPTLSSNNDKSINRSNSNYQASKGKETIFIIDWDDTLMCTTFISRKVSGLSDDEQYIVSNLGKVVSNFLKECNKYGKIIIMTNSSKEWIKKTTKDYLKINHESFDNIAIISTRDRYLKKGIEKKKWKELALDDLIAKYKEKIQNLICVSDSEKDIDVFKNLSTKNKEINISTIKFKTKPSPLIMIKEIKYLNDMMDEIIGKNKNYYLFKEKQKNDDFNLSFGSLLDYIFPN
jgi:HD superfamily phosphohydrolase